RPVAGADERLDDRDREVRLLEGGHERGRPSQRSRPLYCAAPFAAVADGPLLVRGSEVRHDSPAIAGCQAARRRAEVWWGKPGGSSLCYANWQQINDSVALQIFLLVLHTSTITLNRSSVKVRGFVLFLCGHACQHEGVER